MIRIQAEVSIHTATLSARRASYLIRRRLPTLEHYYCKPPIHLYASERAGKTLDIERIAMTAADASQRVVRLLGDIVSLPTHIYLLDPQPGMRRCLIQGFRWGGILVNSSAIVYSTTPQHLYSAIGREIVRMALPPIFGRYFFLYAGLSEYLARGDDETFYHDVAAVLDNPLMYSLHDILEGYAPVPAVGSFAQFLTEQFGGEVWMRVHEDIRSLRRGFPPLLSLLPSRDWLLKRCTGLSIKELGELWLHFVHLQTRSLDQQRRQAYSDKLDIWRLYEDRDWRECADACLRYLSVYGSDVEVIFYTAASCVRLGDYWCAIRVLSSHADALPQWHKAWAYLRLGQLYDAVGNREPALRSYAVARDLSDVWGVIGSQAERYSARPVPQRRLGVDNWLHFRQWQCYSGHEGVPYSILALYYHSGSEARTGRVSR